MTRPLWTLTLLVCFAALVGCGGDDGTTTPSDSSDTPPAAAPETYDTPAAIGGKVPDFAVADFDGLEFQLSALDASRADIEATLRSVGAAYGLADGAALDTKLATLSGLQEDGELDTWTKWELLSKAGSVYGRAATEESVESINTLADAVDWIERLNGAPTVLMVWSPRCKTCPKMNDQVHETLAATDARVFAVASSWGDKASHFDKYREMLDFHMRILPDDAQAMNDYLGAKTTPTFVVVDKDRTLIYRGALDDDPMGIEDLEARVGYVLAAIKAAGSGATPDDTETDAPG